MVSGVFGGVAMAENMVAWARRVTTGNVTSVIAGPQVILRAEFALDGGKSPATVDYRNLTGTHKGKTQAGIFQLEGDDLLVCVAAPGGQRPREFASAKGDGRSLTAWRRIKTSRPIT